MYDDFSHIYRIAFDFDQSLSLSISASLIKERECKRDGFFHFLSFCSKVLLDEVPQRMKNFMTLCTVQLITLHQCYLFSQWNFNDKIKTFFHFVEHFNLATLISFLICTVSNTTIENAEIMKNYDALWFSMNFIHIQSINTIWKYPKQTKNNSGGAIIFFLFQESSLNSVLSLYFDANILPELHHWINDKNASAHMYLRAVILIKHVTFVYSFGLQTLYKEIK